MTDPKTPPAAVPPPSAGGGLPGSSLCMSCGLCCMGVIHNNGVLQPEEVPAMRQLGLQVTDQDRPLFALPCPRFSGGRCTVYRDRPGACVRYRCQVLQDFEAGQIGFDQALDRVASAKAHLERLVAAMPGDMALKDAKALIRAPTGDSPASRQLAKVRLLATALELYVDKHFRHSKEARSLELAVVEPASEEMR